MLPYKMPTNHKRCSEVVEVEISSAESFCSTSQILTHSGTHDTFVIVNASTQKTRPLLHKLASSLRRSVLFLRFTCGVWPSTGRGVDRVSRIRSAKIKTANISSEMSGCISAKFAPAKTSRYMVFKKGWKNRSLGMRLS